MNIRAIFDNPWVFELSQRLIPFTVWVYEGLIRAHRTVGPDSRVLDVGCGFGAHRKFFPEGEYLGVDINPGYIERATRMYGPSFQVMDATALEVPPEHFTDCWCVATFHHLSDEQVSATLGGVLGALRAGGRVHVIDPIVPLNPRAWFKRWVFANDRGRFQRRREHLLELAGRFAEPRELEFVRGWLHDVIYFQLQKPAASGAS